MANDLGNSEDVSAMMEALWGPRAEGPTHVPTRPADRPAGHHDADAREVGRTTRQQDIHEELALLDEWGRESAERLATLESAVDSELHRLSVAVEASRAGMAATGDLEALRTELMNGMAAGQAELRADLEAGMVEQVSLVLEEALKQDDARAAVAAAELNGRDDASVGREEFVALRAELTEALSRHISASEEALQQRVALLDTTIAGARAEMADRLDQMATSAEAARAAERASAKAVDAAPPLQADVRTLQKQMVRIATVVARLQRQFPAS